MSTFMRGLKQFNIDNYLSWIACGWLHLMLGLLVNGYIGAIYILFLFLWYMIRKHHWNIQYPSPFLLLLLLLFSNTLSARARTNRARKLSKIKHLCETLLIQVLARSRILEMKYSVTLFCNVLIHCLFYIYYHLKSHLLMFFFS